MPTGTQRWHGTGFLGRLFLLLALATFAACDGGSSGPNEPTEIVPSIDLEPTGQGWSASPKDTSLTRVSNNGLGYTGEIDRFELVAPAPGRLQLSLTWDHDANFDLILASDEIGKLRLAEGVENGSAPEYVGTDVVEGQRLFLFVAGWTGDPGPYKLEVLLLPPGTPLFDLESTPDFTNPWPSDVPLVFTFTTDLDPDQEVMGRASIVHAGGEVQGVWCIDGRTLTFYPQLPGKPGDPHALVPGALHILTFPRAAAGLRAATGEYLSDLKGIAFYIGAPKDLWPLAPQVTGITPNPSAAYKGDPITLAISEPLDPATVAPQLISILDNGTTLPLPFQFQLSQVYHCGGDVEVRLFVLPSQAPPPGSTTRLSLLPRTMALGGGPDLHDSMPVVVDFAPP
jgi:hypothetical protein